VVGLAAEAAGRRGGTAGQAEWSERADG